MKAKGWGLWGSALAVFLVVLAGLWWIMKEKYDVDKTPESYSFVAKFEKEGVPPVEALQLDGKQYDFSAIKAPVVIVNFWASWCNPCVEEFPSMLKLVEALPGKIAVIAISMDDDEKDLRTFAKLFAVPRAGFDVVWDKEKKMMSAYGVGKLPESFIVGPDRKLVRKVLGIENWASESAVAYFDSIASGGH